MYHSILLRVALRRHLFLLAMDIFEVQFDFLDHQLDIITRAGTRKSLPLVPRSVAAFYADFMEAMDVLGLPVRIDTHPCEVPNAIPFERDEEHHQYDPVAVQRYWRVLLQTEEVLRAYRSRFIGKASPVQFFWGSFDLALSVFSGRRAPERPGSDRITHEAYSHELISGGFWPGDDRFPEPAFYAYAAPSPAGLEQARVCPSSAFWNDALGEFLLRYEDIRQDAVPAQRLQEFYESVYDAGATLANWDRTNLERSSR